VHFDIAARGDAHTRRSVGFECAGQLATATSGVVGNREGGGAHFPPNKTNNSIAARQDTPQLSAGSNGNLGEEGEVVRDFVKTTVRRLCCENNGLWSLR
jgi:hypothetical protein